MIEELSTNEYIQQKLNIILIGASGSGKTWISNAFGVNACMERYKVQYIRLPDLFQEIEEAKIQGHYKKYMKKLSKVDFLILDEFLLTPISECERNDLLEVIQSRTDKKSTIYCSQWAPEGWLGKLGDGPLADAILDRIRNSSYTILLKGRSLREDYSKIEVALSNGLHGSVQMDSVDLFLWIGWLCHHGILFRKKYFIPFYS